MIKRFQGDEPNKRCHERVCLVTNTQRAGEGCRSQVPGRAVVFVYETVATATEGPVSASRLSLRGDFGQMDRRSEHAVPNAEYDSKRSAKGRVFTVMNYVVLFYFYHNFSTIIIAVTTIMFGCYHGNNGTFLLGLREKVQTGRLLIITSFYALNLYKTREANPESSRVIFLNNVQ